ncbi:MAG: hypothetical protein MZW92_31045 [Comamonadaceae bacterium]|nr:hypothetical protein [Comamonadaceae bacterium]
MQTIQTPALQKTVVVVNDRYVAGVETRIPHDDESPVRSAIPVHHPSLPCLPGDPLTDRGIIPAGIVGKSPNRFLIGLRLRTWAVLFVQMTR